MPLYEFVCMACEDRFEALLSMSEGDPSCPACGGARVRRQLSVFAAGTPSSRGGGSAGMAPSSGGGCGCGGACACGRH